MKLLIFFLLFSHSLFAQELSDKTYIITHPSRHYQTSQRLIDETNSHLKHFSQKNARIIGLYQNQVATDHLWYAKPISYFTELYYSHAGEHKLYFPIKPKDSYTIYLSGGYLSACLGRTASNLVNNFLRTEVQANSLELIFYANTVFTGFLEKGGQLEPKTPYRESILDDSIDGLSFAKAIQLVPPNNYKEFLIETMKIAVLQKAPLANREEFMDFNLVIEYENHEYYLIKSNTHHAKKITLKFR